MCSSENNSYLLKKEKTFQKPCFTGTQNSHSVNIKKNKKNKNKTIIIQNDNNKRKVVVGLFLSRKKKGVI